MTLTLALVTVLVINRLDDYFTSQQRADLEQRAKTVETYVSRLFTKLSLPEDGGGHRRVLAVLTYLRQGGP